jgi:hypothetical protein
MKGFTPHFQANEKKLKKPEICYYNPMFKLKSFQRRDLARAALHDGLILASEPGLGKTVMGISWMLLKVGLHPDAKGMLIPKEPCLIVAPEGLFDQMEHDYKQSFGAAWPGVTRLTDQDTFLKLGKLKPGWFLSSFTQIASNKIKQIPSVPQSNGLPNEELTKLMNFFGVKVKDAVGHRLAMKSTRNYDTGQEELSFFRYTEANAISDLTEASIHDKALDLCAEKRRMLAEGVGTENAQGVRCTYSPSLADLVRHAFGCVAIDEAVRIKSEDSIIGIGVRSLCPKYRIVLTGTPIKNRLPDIFFLAAWACDALDEANARWPYCGNKNGEKEKFEQEFCVTGRDLTKERQAAEADGRRYVPTTESFTRKDKRRRGKPTAEVCNIHRLWKLLAPVVLRRRKADIGEDIVPKIRRPIVVPMGEEQAKVTKYHLAATYLDKNDQPAIGAQLQALRSCAAAPHNQDTLHDKGPVEFYPKDHPQEGMPMPYIYYSRNPFTPRNLACLRVIEEVLSRREQVVVGSSFHEANDQLSRLLTEAGVPHYLLDGRMNPSKRGVFATEFKQGLPHARPVLLAGNRSCGEGYSWEKCNNLIAYNHDWALDTALQLQERVHRLNSKKAVNYYPILCSGTIDAKLESMIGEKTDSAELVLDGKLIGQVTEEVNLLQLLNLAHSEFTLDGTVDEKGCEREWPALCARLNAAYAAMMAAPPVIPVEQKKAQEIVVDALRAPALKIHGEFAVLNFPKESSCQTAGNRQ